MAESDSGKSREPLDDETLEVRLTRAMASNLRVIAQSIPPRARFSQMLAEYGAIGTWARVKQGETSGFTDLYLHRLLHLSLEALVVQNSEYHRLFSEDDLTEMRRLLTEHGYCLE